MSFSNKGSVLVYNQFLRSRRLSILVASIGENDKAARAEMATEPAITMLNSLNKRPVIPCINTMGRKTAIRVMVVETTAKKISLDPFDAGLVGWHASFNAHINVFGHHYGIVHHQPNGKHNSEHREHVNGKAGQEHNKKGTYQRNGNHHHRYQGYSPIAQEKEDNKHHKGEGNKNSVPDFVDRSTYKARIVEGNVYTYVFGQVFLS